MGRVVFDIINGERIIKSKTFFCADGLTSCPPPKWEWNDTNYEQITRAHFQFEVPKDLDPDTEY